MLQIPSPVFDNPIFNQPSKVEQTAYLCNLVIVPETSIVQWGIPMFIYSIDVSFVVK